MSKMTTSNPNFASLNEKSRPRPPPPPVTKANSPFKFLSGNPVIR